MTNALAAAVIVYLGAAVYLVVDEFAPAARLPLAALCVAVLIVAVVMRALDWENRR